MIVHQQLSEAFSTLLVCTKDCKDIVAQSEHCQLDVWSVGYCPLHLPHIIKCMGNRNSSDLHLFNYALYNDRQLHSTAASYTIAVFCHIWLARSLARSIVEWSTALVLQCFPAFFLGSWCFTSHFELLKTSTCKRNCCPEHSENLAAMVFVLKQTLNNKIRYLDKQLV